MFARFQSYLFAHKVVPEIFFSCPEDFMKDMRDIGKDILRERWELLGSLPWEEIGIDSVSNDSYDLVVFQLPLPMNVTEAYFTVCLVQKKKKAANLKRRLARYFTLEFGHHMDGSQRTVLCEWTKERHINYGDGPEPDKQQFITTILKVIGDFPPLNNP